MHKIVSVRIHENEREKIYSRSKIREIDTRTKSRFEIVTERIEFGHEQIFKCKKHGRSEYNGTRITILF